MKFVMTVPLPDKPEMLRVIRIYTKFIRRYLDFTWGKQNLIHLIFCEIFVDSKCQAPETGV